MTTFFGSLLHVVNQKEWRLQICSYLLTQREKATIHQVTIMLSASKNMPFPGQCHLLTTSADDPTLQLLPERQQGDN